MLQQLMHYPVATVGFVIAPRGVGTMIGMFLVGRIINPVPAVTEAAAIGDIAEIFADIRRVLGVGVVNLIWRHLTTIPGALPWAWGTVRPLYVDGTIATEAAALHDDIDVPKLPAFPPEVLAAAGLLQSDVNTIREVLAAYDRTNAMAIVALSALLRRLDDEPLPAEAAQSSGGHKSHELPSEIPLPPLSDMADLLPATADLVLTLNRLGTRRDNAILASMYRHLAQWPAYLAMAWTIIAPLDADGRLSQSIADITAKARSGLHVSPRACPRPPSRRSQPSRPRSGRRSSRSPATLLRRWS